MKFSTISIAIVNSIALATLAFADDESRRANYRPYSKSLSEDSFFEQFNKDWYRTWKPSKAKKDDELSYVGKWSVEESIVFPGFRGDKGLVAKSEAALHAISAKLPKKFDNTNNTLVLQYEVKFQNGLECGGAYIKLLSAKADENNDEFSDKTPYLLMFGPDKCGSSNKVHFIINRRNPLKNEYEEHHLKIPPMARIVKTTSLYTLIIKPNQDFEIRIDGNVAISGNLLNSIDFNLSIPETIADKSDLKPENWDEDEFIPDPSDIKPEDWDESIPYLIPDLDATKPDDWYEDEPEMIPNPRVHKPEDWDDEEDGEWSAPIVDNPRCDNRGCGKWIRPSIRNPDFKGKWHQKLIKNPDFKGEWKPKQIPNSDYFEDSHPSNLELIGGLGFEIWTMDSNILFDNIYLGHSIKEAEDIGNSTFLPKSRFENLDVDENYPNIKHPNNFETNPYFYSSVITDIYEYIVGHIKDFIADLQYYLSDVVDDPIETLFERPGEAVFFSSVILGTFGSIFGTWAFIISALSSMIGSYTQPDKTAYVGSKKTTKPSEIPEKTGDFEKIEEKADPSESKKNETEATKR